MSVTVVVPTLGESITEAIISRWEVAEGDLIERDAPLVELETDKITVTVPSPVTGVITKLTKGLDETVAVGEVIAEIDETLTAPTASTPVAAEAATPAPATPTGEQPHLSPSVRRLAEEHAIDPAQVNATGPKDNLTKGDMLAHIAQQPAAAAAPATPAPVAPTPAPKTPAVPLLVTPAGPEEEEHVRMSMLRRRVAERLVEAQQTAAILTTFNEADMSAVMDLRRRYKDAFLERYNVKLGFMSFFVKAVIEALKAYPSVNAELRDNTVVYKKYYHIGVAVGGGRGLVVPVMRHADQRSFSDVEVELGSLASKAMKNQLTLDDLTGGTFTISNGGVYGSMMSTPILNPPQPGILGMHKIQERPVVVDGKIVARPMMYLALSYDHRIIDGREAVGFLVRVKECIENPERMLLEV